MRVCPCRCGHKRPRAVFVFAVAAYFLFDGKRYAVFDCFFRIRSFSVRQNDKRIIRFGYYDRHRYGNRSRRGRYRKYIGKNKATADIRCFECDYSRSFRNGSFFVRLGGNDYSGFFSVVFFSGIVRKTLFRHGCSRYRFHCVFVRTRYDLYSRDDGISAEAFNKIMQTRSSYRVF